MLLHGVKDTEFEIHHGDTLVNDWRILSEENPAKKMTAENITATFGHCVRCGMALYEQARQATPQPPQANAYALAIKQSRCTHLNMRLPCIGVLRFNAPAQRRLAKSPIVRPRLWVLRERNESFSLFFVFGESRPLVIVCVAVWLYTSKLAKPHPNPHRLTPMLSP